MEQSFFTQVLYSDDYLFVVDKPAGLPVHKNDFMPHDAPYLTKLMGDRFGKWIYNVHRLDSKTSGVMVLAFSSETARELTLQFERKEVDKKYIAVVQGVPGSGSFTDKVVVKKKSKFKKPAVTRFTTLKSKETGISYKDKTDIIISMAEVVPETGRWHQIRQHFAKNRFDIVGDSHHGDFTLNKIITEKTGIYRLMLHASELEFYHPVLEKRIRFNAPLPEDFNRLFEMPL